MERHFDPIVVIFGIIQIAFYVDFAWVYWTRQRVKLRNGAVVDSDDLSRGWLVSRLLAHKRDSFDEEDGAADNAATGGFTKPARGSWGPRGISVSADDQVLSEPESGGHDERGHALQNEESHPVSHTKDHHTQDLQSNSFENGSPWQEHR